MYVCKGVMSKAKWYVVRKPSLGEKILKAANLIVPLKVCRRYKIDVHIYYLMAEKAIWLDIARMCICIIYHSDFSSI